MDGHRAAKLRELSRQARRQAEDVAAAPWARMLPASRLRRVHVVAHTHWDREWWATAATYRGRLIRLIDGVMDLLEQTPDFRSFTFDGQVAPIDDYLAALPEATRIQAEARLRRLIRDGRLHIGPWYTLSDQFLVSGETTLRNLERGLRRARELGRAMEIAYCPDQFGLMAELPKVLRQVGIDRVIGQRGMAPELPGQFRWQAADGSVVDVVNLRDGYFHPHQNAFAIRALARRTRGLAALFLAGYDHSVPTVDLVEQARRAGTELSSLPEYWRSLASFAATPVHRGEIRSAGVNCILPNVISNRVDQRLLTAQAERYLERYAEPLAALQRHRPTTLLEGAWTDLILNAAHDSACATGIDAVTREVMTRAQDARDTAAGIAQAALDELAPGLERAGRYCWNPSNFTRDLLVPVRGGYRIARDVPPLGWGPLERLPHRPRRAAPPPGCRITRQGDRGDTYTFDPWGHERTTEMAVAAQCRPGEPFTRLSVHIDNRSTDQRTRLIIPLPEPAPSSVTDTAFGSVTRPAVPALVQGRDRLNGFPAGRFIVAGGLAVLVDRVVEYEILPDTNELAITLLRSHGALSVRNPKYRLMAAGPRLATHDTQMLGPLDWQLAVMPWRSATALPWREWEQFMLDPLTFDAPGGGTLPARGSWFRDLPTGVLSAVLPEGVRSFEPTGTHALTTSPLHRALPGAERAGIA